MTAILLRIPGTPIAATTLLDGHPMAANGWAGDAIGLAVSASAIGGIFAGLIILVFSSLLSAVALCFAPPEYFALAMLGLFSIAVVAIESVDNACCGGTLIPTLSLGIPGDASSTALMGTLFLLGFLPGP